MKKFYFQIRSYSGLIFFLCILWTTIIIIGSCLPGKDIPSLTTLPNIDKVVHLLFFFHFFLLWRIYYYKKTNYEYNILIISILLGVGIEYYQRYCVNGRSYDIKDIIADTLGAFLGLFFSRWLMMDTQSNNKP